MTGLPKLDLPRHKHFLQGIQKDITYRGFTVKEQKILLHAKESEDENQIKEATKQIIELCVLNDDINVDALPFFDIEDIFLRIRSRSVSNIVDIIYRVKDDNGQPTKDKVKVTINLDDVQVTFPEGHDKNIKLTDSLGVMMKYPSLSMLDTRNDLYEMIRQCIDFIYNGEEVFYLKDYSEEEVEECLDSFDTDAIKKFQKFFETIPRLRHTEVVKLPDGSETTLKFEGLTDFFQ